MTRRAVFSVVFLAVAIFTAAPIAYAQVSDKNTCDAKGGSWDASARICHNLPPSSLKAGSINISYLKGYGTSIQDIINQIIVPVIIALAFLLFIWGVFKAYIWSQASDTERQKGHQFILWSVIAFVVIFSVWGLVRLTSAVLNLDQAGTTAPKPPTIQ